MLNLIGTVLNLILIITIFLKTPQENIEFLTKNKTIKPLESNQKGLNLFIALMVCFYFGIAIKLNFV